MKQVAVITDSFEWDRALLTLPQPHILQSWTWGALKERQGWQATRFLWLEQSQPLAAVQILRQQRGRLRVGYAPKGPLVDWNNLPLVREVSSHLMAFAQAHHLMLLKVDPDVQVDTSQGQAVCALLLKQGWCESSERVQFRNTMTLDLSADLDTLMAQLRAKWRYNVRLAARHGVLVREAQVADLPLLYQMYAETAARDNFIIRDRTYYLEVWERFMAAGHALPLIAELGGEPLAMVFVLHFGSYAWYMYGASRALRREVMPNHLLQWEAIRRLRALGCRHYDLWGAPDVLDESDPMWGVYRFKLGLGATLVRHIGAYDYPPNRWLYRLYALLRPRIVAYAQQRYWTQVASDRLSRTIHW
ncbi:MAG TPA: peptidoglycan bridge formation glycyltransferase FemA/FemB family protein [Anaerolineae bacterium]|nr:peptidoglycan bridge formation glycyltransferase FemA/FemB family protein [Anaerolineae bacterium]